MRKCKQCSIDISSKQSQAKFCSGKCRNKSYYETRKDDLNKRINKSGNHRRHIRRKKIVEYCGGKCNRCGYDKNLTALTFHHIDPADKTFTLDGSSLGCRSWQAIVEESQKCELLCHNCHAEHHNPQHDNWKNGNWDVDAKTWV